MVTFTLPNENDVADAGRSTPRPRPPLPFAKRAYVSSPFTNKRLGTPQSAPSKRLLANRTDLPPSNLNKSTIASARNIFRASSISNSPPTHPFSPTLSQSTVTKLFVPGATPEPNRVFRESTAQATPRGMASKMADKQLFHMRIEDPDPELSGEVLTKKVPKEWNSKGSIYADQFLAHLCPPEFDEEQRRQFFCILDLRRLKYAADEIFSKKDWKLNVINFAKEFEKSRSIILLRYGLYEFQSVKPSKEVLKRWRREHGLPEPEEDADAEPTPTKNTAPKKRKADDDLPKNTGLATNNNKRRVTDKDEEEQEAPAATPAPTNKRKASVSDETETQPNKMQKATPSAAKTLFEKIANKSSTPAGSPVKATTKPAGESTTSKVNPFTAPKTNGANSLARSVFQNMKSGNAQAGGNIFGYLSDASSTKNSGVDADVEGETESDAEDSEEPSAAASAAETSSQVDSSNAFGNLSAPTDAAAAGSSAPGTRESTPGRSLFDRVTKDSTGQPVRMEDKDEEAAPEKPAAKPLDQTWNPSNTPIKFAPTSAPQSNSLFGNTTPATSTPSSSIFGTKPSTSNIFGAKQDKPAEKESSAEAVVNLKDKSGSESDKENDEAPKKSMFEAKAPALQNNATSLFPPKAPTDTPKAAEPVKPLFGATKADDKPAEPAAASSNIFGSLSKPAESTTPSAPLQSVFGAKPVEAPKPTTSLFGASSTPSTSTPTPATTTNLFGAKPTTTTSDVPFGGASSTPAAKPLFGASSFGDASTPKTDAAPTTTPAAPPTFKFGVPSTDANKPNGTSEAAPKSLFPTPNSPKHSATAFDGSPMKQDGPSPAKKAFNGAGASSLSSAPIFFGNTSSTTSAAPIFGNASTTPANSGSLFGPASSTNTSSGGANFSFAASGTGFNPFNSGNNGDSNGTGSNSTPGGMFNFGGGNSSVPNTSAPFQFGGAAAPGPTFGGNQGNNPAPAFGAAPSSGASTPFAFGAGSALPPAPSFGSNQAATGFHLQPPAGGASTGTNTPFSLGGGSSLATTPAGGTPEPSASAQGTTAATEEEGEKHEQINLTEGMEKDEEILHDVRAKVLKFAPATDKSDDKPKSKSPWTTQGVGPLRLLKHKETGDVRLLMRAEPRGNVALNRTVLPNMDYKADEKYVKLTTSNETGDGLETWMIQVKTKDLAKGLAEALEKHKELNKK